MKWMILTAMVMLFMVSSVFAAPVETTQNPSFAFNCTGGGGAGAKLSDGAGNQNTSRTCQVDFFTRWTWNVSTFNISYIVTQNDVFLSEGVFEATNNTYNRSPFVIAANSTIIGDKFRVAYYYNDSGVIIYPTNGVTWGVNIVNKQPRFIKLTVKNATGGTGSLSPANNNTFVRLVGNISDPDNDNVTVFFCSTGDSGTTGKAHFNDTDPLFPSCNGTSYGNVTVKVNTYFDLNFGDGAEVNFSLGNNPSQKNTVWAFAIDSGNGISYQGNVTFEINHPPFNLSAPVLNVTTATTGDLINCSLGSNITDPDNDTITISYHWYADGVLLVGRGNFQLNVTTAVTNNSMPYESNVTCEMYNVRDSHSYNVQGVSGYNSTNSAYIFQRASDLAVTILSPVNTTYTDWCTSPDCKLFFNFSTTGTALGLCDINLTKNGAEIYHGTSANCSSLTHPIISNGEYKVFVYTINTTGTIGGNATTFFTVSITAPNAVFSQPNGSYNVTTIPINVTANPCTETLVLEINGTNSTVFSNASSCSPVIAYYTTITRGSGNYTIKAFASDHLGGGDALRTSITIASFEVAIPLPPAPPITGKVVGGTAVLLNMVPLIFLIGFLMGVFYLGFMKEVKLIVLGVYCILGIVVVIFVTQYVGSFV